MENGEVKRLKAEVSKLRELQLSQKDSYEGEVQGLKTEISRLTKDLHDRTKSMASINEESSQIETQLRNEMETLERRQAELQVCTKVILHSATIISSCTNTSHHWHFRIGIHIIHSDLNLDYARSLMWQIYNCCLEIRHIKG